MAYKVIALIPKGCAHGGFGEMVSFPRDTEFTVYMEKSPRIEKEKWYYARYELGMVMCNGEDISVKQVIDIDNKNAHEDIGKIVIFSDAPVEEYDKDEDCKRNKVIKKFRWKGGAGRDVREFYRHYGIVEDFYKRTYRIKTESGKTVFAQRGWICFTDEECAKKLLQSVGKKVIINGELETGYGFKTDKYIGQIGTIIGVDYIAYTFGKAASFFVQIGKEIFAADLYRSGISNESIVLAKKEFNEGEGVLLPCLSCENCEEGVCRKWDGMPYKKCYALEKWREFFVKAYDGELEF